MYTNPIQNIQRHKSKTFFLYRQQIFTLHLPYCMCTRMNPDQKVEKVESGDIRIIELLFWLEK